MLLCFLEVVASVDVHPLDHGAMGNLQGGQTQGKVRLPRQNNWEYYRTEAYCVLASEHNNTHIKKTEQQRHVLQKYIFSVKHKS